MLSARDTEETAMTAARSVADDRKGPRDLWVTESWSVRDIVGRGGTSHVFVPRSGVEPTRGKGGDGIQKIRDVMGIPETRPEPESTHKVSTFLVSDPAGAVDVSLGGIHWRAREEVCVAVAIPLPVL